MRCILLQSLRTPVFNGLLCSCFTLGADYVCFNPKNTALIMTCVGKFQINPASNSLKPDDTAFVKWVIIDSNNSWSPLTGHMLICLLLEPCEKYKRKLRAKRESIFRKVSPANYFSDLHVLKFLSDQEIRVL